MSSSVPAAVRDSDARTAETLLKGDADAAAEFYRNHAPAVARMIWWVIGDESAVEDLVQETFLTALTRLNRFQGQSSLATWVRGIAINCARNHRAKSRRRSRLAHWLRAPEEPSARWDPDLSLREQEAMRELNSALNVLDIPQRECFVLRVLEDLSLRETANVLGVPVSTVSHRTRRAEAAVREHLEKSAKEEP